MKFKSNGPKGNVDTLHKLDYSNYFSPQQIIYLRNIYQ